jgi:hypothetical protein
VGNPRLLPQSQQYFINFLRIKINGEVIGPVTRALLIVNGDAFHPVAVAEAFDVDLCLLHKLFNPGVTINVRITGYLFQGVFQALAKNWQPRLFPLACDNGFRLIEIASESRPVIAASNNPQQQCQEQRQTCCREDSNHEFKTH